MADLEQTIQEAAERLARRVEQLLTIGLDYGEVVHVFADDPGFRAVVEALVEIAAAPQISCAHGHPEPCDCGGDKVRAALALLTGRTGDG